MGFYGNSFSSMKTNLTFDKHYTNRTTMEANAGNDGVYAGRYVLVEYSLSGPTAQVPGFYSASNKKYYADLAYAKDLIIQVDVLYLIMTNADDYNQKGAAAQYDLYIGTNYGVLTKMTSGASSSQTYLTNFYIDRETYGDIGQGFDSTVWQKVYEADEKGVSKAKYINIASLNSVVPTFKISVDAPSAEGPVAPHFGPNGSNVMYDLHMAPNWGFRIANNQQSDDWHGKSNVTDQAIYYNAEAFSPTKANAIDNTSQNFITLKPTGVSGKEYVLHNAETNEITVGIAPDIQEFRLSLPAIGNMMAKGWDIIHGTKRDNSPADSLQGRLNFFQGKDVNGVSGLQANQIPLQSGENHLIGADVIGDDWIIPEVDANFAHIVFTHDYKHKMSKDEEVSANTNSSDSDIVDLYDSILDDTGHVIGKKITHTTLPYGFKTIVSGKTSNVSSAGATNTNSIVATASKDTLTISANNRWITTSAANKELQIGHAAAGESKSTAGDTTAITKPTFGSSFNTTVVKYDATGHISEVATRNVEFPIGSFNNPAPEGTTSNVLTSFEFEPSTGAITVNNRNLSSLKLAGYTSSVATGDHVQNSDTLGEGIKKIDDRLDAINTSINQRINTEVETLEQSITSNVSDLNDRIDDEVETLEKSMAGNVNTLDAAIKAEAGRAAAAEEALGVRINNILDGITEEELNTFKELSDALGDDANFAANVNKAIANVQTSVDNEVARADAKEQELETLLRNLTITVNSNNGFLSGRITTEEQTARAAEQQLQESINSISDELAQEKSRVEQADEQFTSKLGEMDTAISGINNTLTSLGTKDEELAAADTELQNAINAVAEDLQNNYALKESTFTKDEINETLGGYVLKTELDYYTKSETDNMFVNYALKEEIPTDFYTKAEVDAMHEQYASTIEALLARIEALEALINPPVDPEPDPETPSEGGEDPENGSGEVTPEEGTDEPVVDPDLENTPTKE